MVAAGPLNPTKSREARTVRRIQFATLAAIALLWQAAGSSGLFYRGVFPSVFSIAEALGRLLLSPDFYELHFATTAYEALTAFVIGATVGAAVGLALGALAYAGEVFEPILYYLAPTPKIVFLPVFLVMFGVGPGSKIALGAISCFFPMALSVASGVRQIDPVLLRVGRSLRLNRLQMLQKIYFPALRPPVGSGLRLSFGLAVVGSLLAELKLSNQGLGYLALDEYRQFDLASMFAVVIVIFATAALCNRAIGWIIRAPGPESRKAGRKTTQSAVPAVAHE